MTNCEPEATTIDASSIESGSLHKNFNMGLRRRRSRVNLNLDQAKSPRCNIMRTPDAAETDSSRATHADLRVSLVNSHSEPNALHMFEHAYDNTILPSRVALQAFFASSAALINNIKSAEFVLDRVHVGASGSSCFVGAFAALQTFIKHYPQKDYQLNQDQNSFVAIRETHKKTVDRSASAKQNFLVGDSKNVGDHSLNANVMYKTACLSSAKNRSKGNTKRHSIAVSTFRESFSVRRNRRYSSVRPINLFCKYAKASGNEIRSDQAKRDNVAAKPSVLEKSSADTNAELTSASASLQAPKKTPEPSGGHLQKTVTVAVKRKIGLDTLKTKMPQNTTQIPVQLDLDPVPVKRQRPTNKTVNTSSKSSNRSKMRQEAKHRTELPSRTDTADTSIHVDGVHSGQTNSSAVEAPERLQEEGTVRLCVNSASNEAASVGVKAENGCIIENSETDATDATDHTEAPSFGRSTAEEDCCDCDDTTQSTVIECSEDLLAISGSKDDTKISSTSSSTRESTTFSEKVASVELRSMPSCHEASESCKRTTPDSSKAAPSPTESPADLGHQFSKAVCNDSALVLCSVSNRTTQTLKTSNMGGRVGKRVSKTQNELIETIETLPVTSEDPVDSIISENSTDCETVADTVQEAVVSDQESISESSASILPIKKEITCSRNSLSGLSILPAKRSTESSEPHTQRLVPAERLTDDDTAHLHSEAESARTDDRAQSHTGSQALKPSNASDKNPKCFFEQSKIATSCEVVAEPSFASDEVESTGNDTLSSTASDLAEIPTTIVEDTIIEQSKAIDISVKNLITSVHPESLDKQSTSGFKKLFADNLGAIIETEISECSNLDPNQQLDKAVSSSNALTSSSDNKSLNVHLQSTDSVKKKSFSFGPPKLVTAVQPSTSLENVQKFSTTSTGATSSNDSTLALDLAHDTTADNEVLRDKIHNLTSPGSNELLVSNAIKPAEKALRKSKVVVESSICQTSRKPANHLQDPNSALRAFKVGDQSHEKLKSGISNSMLDLKTNEPSETCRALISDVSRCSSSRNNDMMTETFPSSSSLVSPLVRKDEESSVTVQCSAKNEDAFFSASKTKLHEDSLQMLTFGDLSASLPAATVSESSIANSDPIGIHAAIDDPAQDKVKPQKCTSSDSTPSQRKAYETASVSSCAILVSKEKKCIKTPRESDTDTAEETAEEEEHACNLNRDKKPESLPARSERGSELKESESAASPIQAYNTCDTSPQTDILQEKGLDLADDCCDEEKKSGTQTKQTSTKLPEPSENLLASNNKLQNDQKKETVGLSNNTDSPALLSKPHITDSQTEDKRSSSVKTENCSNVSVAAGLPSCKSNLAKLSLVAPLIVKESSSEPVPTLTSGLNVSHASSASVTSAPPVGTAPSFVIVQQPALNVLTTPHAIQAPAQVPGTVSVPVQVQSSSGILPRPMIVAGAANCGIQPTNLATGELVTGMLLMNKLVQQSHPSADGVSSSSQPSVRACITSSNKVTAGSLGINSVAGSDTMEITSEVPVNILRAPVQAETPLARQGQDRVGFVTDRLARPFLPTRLVTTVRPSIIRGPRLGASHSQSNPAKPVLSGARVVTLRPGVQASSAPSSARSVSTILHSSLNSLPSTSSVKLTGYSQQSSVSSVSGVLQQPPMKQKISRVNIIDAGHPLSTAPSMVPNTASISATTSARAIPSSCVIKRPISPIILTRAAPNVTPSMEREADWTEAQATSHRGRKPYLQSSAKHTAKVSLKTAAETHFAEQRSSSQKPKEVITQIANVTRNETRIIKPMFRTTKVPAVKGPKLQQGLQTLSLPNDSDAQLPTPSKGGCDSQFKSECKLASPTPSFCSEASASTVAADSRKLSSESIELAVDHAASAVARLLQEPELPQPKPIGSKPLSKKQKNMRKTDLIKTKSSRTRRRATDMIRDYNEDRIANQAPRRKSRRAIAVDSGTDSQEDSLHFDESIGVPPSEDVNVMEDDVTRNEHTLEHQNDIPVAVVEVFLSQDEVKLREVHSPTKQDLAEISRQHQQEHTDSCATDMGIVTNGQSPCLTKLGESRSTSDGFFVNEAGVSSDVPTFCGSSSAKIIKPAPVLVSSNDNAFAKALMSSDDALLLNARHRKHNNSGTSGGNKRKNNPLLKD